MALYKWDVKLAWIWVSNWIVTSATAPVSPIEWMVWYDTTNDQLKVYDWTNWNIAGKEYVQGNWINISNDTVSVDTTVVATQTDLGSKQDTLVSGTNIKTINWEAVLGSWDITIQSWQDYSWVTKTISWWEVELWLRTIVNIPDSDFTLTAPATLIEWEEYVIRIISEDGYTMTLWTGFTNPRSVDLSLSKYATDQYVFLAINWELELQPLFTTN